MRKPGTCGRRAIVLAMALLFMGLNAAPELRAQGRVVDQEQFDVVIKFAALLHLRVGSRGSMVDIVTFQVDRLPGTGSVPGVSSGPNPIPVRATAWGLYGQMRLTAESSIPLSDGSGNQIPFTEFYWTGGGDIPDGSLAGVSGQLILATSHKQIAGSMSFFYSNVNYYPAGIYTGRVTYTLSAP